MFPSIFDIMAKRSRPRALRRKEDEAFEQTRQALAEHFDLGKRIVEETRNYIVLTEGADAAVLKYFGFEDALADELRFDPAQAELRRASSHTGITASIETARGNYLEISTNQDVRTTLPRVTLDSKLFTDPSYCFDPFEGGYDELIDCVFGSRLTPQEVVATKKDINSKPERGIGTCQFELGVDPFRMTPHHSAVAFELRNGGLFRLSCYADRRGLKTSVPPSAEKHRVMKEIGERILLLIQERFGPNFL